MRQVLIQQITIGLLLVFGISFSVMADGVIVKGRFNFSESNSDIKVFIYSSQQFSRTGNKYRNVKKTEGEVTFDKFKIELNDEADLFYLEIVILKNNVDISANLGLREMFLVEKGGHINLEIYDKSILVSGRGANLFNYQYTLFNNKPFSQKKEIAYLIERDYRNAFSERAKQVSAYIQNLEFSLKEYKELFSEAVYNQLYVDILGRFYNKLLYPLQSSFVTLPKQGIAEAKDFFNHHIYPQKIANVNSVYLTRSPYYVEFLVGKEVLKTKFQNTRDEDGFEFEKIFNIVNSEYSGELRDKANLVLFMSISLKNISLNKLELAIDQMELIDFKNQLTEIKAYLSKGTPVFDFILTDSNGKIYTPENFNGKTVLFDFWFVGCLPCLNLAPKLKEFLNKYKDQDNFQFISVNIDKNLPRWLDAIEEEKYTSKNVLNLNAKGFDDPFLVHYNYRSVPKLMIIDKEGNLITSDAPRPILPEQIKELESLIGI